MSSERKTAANRRNAQRSTGPRSPAGKAQASRNAFRHGLSLPPSRDPTLASEVEVLARALADDQAESPTVLEYARRAAEAEIDLLRARAVRLERLSRWIAAAAARDAFETARFPPDLVARMRDVEPMLRDLPPDHPLVRRLSLFAGLYEVALVEVSRSGSNAADRRALADALDRIERYERRALSRRQSALRALDAARAAQIPRAPSTMARRPER